MQLKTEPLRPQVVRVGIETPHKDCHMVCVGVALNVFDAWDLFMAYKTYSGWRKRGFVFNGRAYVDGSRN